MLKNTDYAMLLLVVSISLVASYLLASSFIVSPEARTTQVLNVVEVEEDWPEVSDEIFNSQALNPTQEVRIGGDGNVTPFQNSDDAR